MGVFHKVLHLTAVRVVCRAVPCCAVQVAQNYLKQDQLFHTVLHLTAVLCGVLWCAVLCCAVLCCAVPCRLPRTTSNRTRCFTQSCISLLNCLVCCALCRAVLCRLPRTTSSRTSCSTQSCTSLMYFVVWCALCHAVLCSTGCPELPQAGPAVPHSPAPASCAGSRQQRSTGHPAARVWAQLAADSQRHRLRQVPTRAIRPTGQQQQRRR
jgi:hypothetical protein